MKLFLKILSELYDAADNYDNETDDHDWLRPWLWNFDGYDNDYDWGNGNITMINLIIIHEIIF